MFTIKNKKRKHPKYFYLLGFGIFLFIGVGYSIIYSALSIEGTVINSKNSWDIHFENIVYDENSVSDTGVEITNNTQMNINYELNNPGDVFAFTVDLYNNGSLPALIKTIDMTNLTDAQEKYLRYVVEYDDGYPLQIKDLIKSKERKKIKIKIEYKNLRDTDLYSDEDTNLNLNIRLNFELPEEEVNNVNFVANGSTKKYNVSSLEQEITLDDFNIEDTYKAISCTNGIISTTNDSNKIVLKRVKSNGTCRIYNSLYDAVQNSSNENISLINSSTESNSISVASTKNLTIDLNGKNISGVALENSGNLTFMDSKENGTVSGVNKTIRNLQGTLNIKSGTYERVNSGNTDGGVIDIAGGTVYLSNSKFITDDTMSIFFNNSNSSVKSYIDNCTIKSTNNFALGINENSSGGEFNIKNSTVESGTKEAITILESSNSENIYLCNSKVISPVNDIGSITSPNSKIYFADNNTFHNSTNIPTITTSEHNSRLVSSKIACAE